MSTTLVQRFAPLCLVFLLLFPTSNAAGDSPFSYTPVENILVNCGSFGTSTTLDNRKWIGDVDSKFLPLELSPKQSSLPATADKQQNGAAQVPFETARLSLSPFSYIFPVTAGQKFIRLHFYSASYSNYFDRSNAIFSVKAGAFTLLSNFNASLNADDEDLRDIIYREYCVNIEEYDQRLNITFTPSPSVSNPYAFINGIEILSIPPSLYYIPADDQGVHFIGEKNTYPIDNSKAFETVYRLNVGGKTISPAGDTGMFRRWTQDNDYFLQEYNKLFLPSNRTIQLNFTEVSPYTAPEDVYRNARTMGKNSTINLTYNLTWKFPVDARFDYLIRLHLCEIEPDVIHTFDRVFLIFIANQTAEQSADVIRWSGGNGFPVHKDYAVSMVGKATDKKVFLYIVLGAEPRKWRTRYRNAILNGVEIFKVSDFSNNLGGLNPDPRPPNPPTIAPPGKTKNPNSNRTIIIAVAAGGVAGFVVLSILGFLIRRRGERVNDSGSSDGTSWWGPFSFITNKSTKTRKSSLPSALSRYFSLTEIKAATNNFDDTFIIGVGGSATFTKAI